MLKELVRERLLAAADEIFGLFERTIASYEEQLCRAREENEGQRRKLEAASKSQMVLRNEDFQRLVGELERSNLEHPQPTHVKEEQVESGVSELSLTKTSISSEDDKDQAPKWARLHRNSPGRDQAQAGDSSVLPSQTQDAEEALRSQYQTHMLEQDFKLSDSRDGFSSKQLRSRIHSEEKPFRCSVCSKSFGRKQHMLRHMRGHTGEKPFTCSVCGKKFPQKPNLIHHMRTHTGEKPFSCSVCSKTFPQKPNLTQHMRTHTGEKPFRCSVCGDRFAHRFSLSVHVRKHTGEKPFSCTLCAQIFSQRANMLAHMKTHAGKNTFPCSICNKIYLKKSSLTAHMQKHDPV